MIKNSKLNQDSLEFFAGEKEKKNNHYKRENNWIFYEQIDLSLHAQDLLFSEIEKCVCINKICETSLWGCYSFIQTRKMSFSLFCY